MVDIYNLFAGHTYKAILDRLLSRVDDRIDKREGSVIYDSIAPVAYEIAIMYQELGQIYINTFGDTANRDFLIMLAKDRGLAPYAATQAVVKGEFDVPIELGARFNHEDINFVAFEALELETENGKYYYQMRCETPGTIGNISYGRLTPIDRIQGLTHAYIVSLLIPGEDEEETEIFRERYFDSIHKSPYGGNIDDYMMKIKAIPGVGGCKVYPVWSGGGTVKVVFINSDYEVPSEEMIEEVQDILDPVPHGKGLGVAPIGHKVTVEGGTATPIDVAMKLTYESGKSWATMQELIKKTIKTYLHELSQAWEQSETTIVRIAHIETRVLQLEGILDIQDTKINESIENLILDDKAIPVIGEVTELGT